MDHTQELFLEAMGAAVRGRQVHWQAPMSPIQWESVLQLAQAHRVLPMVFQAVYTSPAAADQPRLMAYFRMQTLQFVALQAQKTAQFLPILRQLQDSGVQPLVVKGIVCRSLYPDPDSRFSADEDLLIPPQQFDLCRQVLEDWGMTCAGSDTDAYEVPFTMEGTAQLLEVHRSLFPPDHAAFCDWNSFFARVHSSPAQADGIPTLPPTEHLLYLILHAYKHFLHSGFGIRQVCDLIFFANAYGSQIDWQYLLECCRQVRAERFAAGLFRIGRKYLHFSLEDAQYPLCWQAIVVDEEPLLQDILDSGLYGDSDMSRKHSSTITLQAAASGSADSRGGLLRSVFPPAKDLQRRYPYLKTQPLLLPVAWTDRLLKYRKETAASRSNTPAQSIRIGNARVALLRKYGILD